MIHALSTAHFWVVFLPWFVSVFGGIVFYWCVKSPWGWLSGVAQQVGYIPLAILTGQWGFIAHFSIYSTVFVRNFLVTRADQRAPEHHKSLCTDCRRADIRATGPIPKVKAAAAGIGPDASRRRSKRDRKAVAV